MSLKLYRGGTLNEDGEKEQLSQIIDLLMANFNDRKNNVYLVVDPKFPGLSWMPQIDCLFYRNGQIAILELKNITTKFETTLGQNEAWQVFNADGNKKPIHEGRINPFHQVKKQRRALTSYMINNEIVQSTTSQNLKKQLSDKVKGWIVTGKGSIPTIKKHPDMFWSKVVPIDNLVDNLSYIGTNDSTAITEHQFKLLLTKTKCIEVDSNEIFLTGVAPKYEYGRSPIVENMIISKNPSEFKKALKYSEELYFINYFDKFKNSIKTLQTSLKKDVYSLLYKWLMEFPNKFSPEDATSIVNMGIKDSDPKIREKSLNFYINTPYNLSDELDITIIEGLQREIHFNIIKLFIYAIRNINNTVLASKTLVSYFRDNLEYQYINSSLKFMQLGKQSKYEDNKLLTDEYYTAEKSHLEYGQTINTWLEVAQDIKTEELNKCILDYIKILKIKFQNELYAGYYRQNTFIQTIEALGIMKNAGAVELLTSILSESNYIDVKLASIQALGNIGNKSVIPEIRKFLVKTSEYDADDTIILMDKTASALAELNDNESFNIIWNEFLNQSVDQNIRFHRENMFRSLLMLDKDKLEKLLWEKVDTLNQSAQSFLIYADWINECASIYTIRKCKSILLKKELSNFNNLHSPATILMYTIWKNFEFKNIGIQTGLSFLKLGRIDLIETGITIAEPYFLNHATELNQYQNIEANGVLGAISEIYVKLGLQDNIETVFQNSSIEERHYIFYCLQRVAPKMYFENYVINYDDKNLIGEFIIGIQGIYLKTYTSVKGMLEDPEYEIIFWSMIKSMKKLENNNIQKIQIDYGDNNIRKMQIYIESYEDNDYKKSGLTCLFNYFENLNKGIIK